jgi:hypothetical protein
MDAFDKNLLNLKIISKIPENGRLKRDLDGVLSLEYKMPIIITGIKRYWLKDSRVKSIEDVGSIIDFAIDRCSKILESRFIGKTLTKCNIEDSFINTRIHSERDKHYETLRLMHDELVGCITGLSNLKTTYYSDPVTVSKIDMIISKIRLFTKDLKRTHIIS